MLLFILTVMVISLVYFIISGHKQQSKVNKAIGYTLAGVLLMFGIAVGSMISTTTNFDKKIKSPNVELIKKEDNPKEEMKKSSS